MFLIDTNVISESHNGARSNPSVRQFWQTVENSNIYLAVQTIGEIRRGTENIGRRGDIQQAETLAQWLELIVSRYADGILEFDTSSAQICGKLMSPNPQHPIDKQIAAIALIHDLTVATRNVDDFRSTGSAS